MDIKKVTGVYFSPAGSTKTVVETTVDELARLFKAECRYISLNTPSDRAQEYQFAPDELVVFRLSGVCRSAAEQDFAGLCSLPAR